jgi:hemolysin activation/secretion protein
VWGRAAVERLDVVTGVRRRLRADASAALGLPFGTAVTVRGFITSADGALPRYEQTMIGGGLATRGYRRGYRVGDNAAGASVSLAYPFGSPLAIVRHGVRTFVDWGATYDAGTKVGDATFDRGVGVGWFANLMAVNAYVDVGRARGGDWRVHVRFGTGF